MVEDPVLGFIIAQDVDLVDVTIEDTLGGRGSLNAKLPLDSAHATNDIIAEGRRAIYALRDGVIQWGGLLWDAPVQMGSDTFDLHCESWLDYWDHRTIWHSRTFTATEQFDIYKTLVDDAQNPADALAGNPLDLGIDVVWNAPSGITRTIIDQYLDHQARNLGDALRTLAASENGFDRAMEYDLGDETITKRTRLYYPRRGSVPEPGGAPHFEFEFDPSPTSKTNVLRRGLERSARSTAHRVRGWGEGADDARLRAQVIDATAGAGYPPLDAAPDWSTESVQANLNARTREFTTRVNHPLTLPQIEVDMNAAPKWGSYQLGDQIRADINDRAASFTGDARIIGWRLFPQRDVAALTLEEV
jgi:hypothetical protein